MAKEIIDAFLSRCSDLLEDHNLQLKEEDRVSIRQELEVILQQYLSDSENYLFDGIKKISDRISTTKQEIGSNVSEDAVQDAQMELDAVVKNTEDATNTILDAAEKIQQLVKDLQDESLKSDIEAQACSIFEACNFQDLTGQRISKVENTLKFVDVAVGDLLSEMARHLGKPSELMTEKEKLDALKNGPQAESSAPSQDDIDKLFEQS
ncbi:protein phosphatase CheZ [Rickettsiales bacterium]|nr:protein phosphatase CheZ [Rickettsiales bacterium]